MAKNVTLKEASDLLSESWGTIGVPVFNQRYEDEYGPEDWAAEYKAEREAETAYERYYDYQAWLRDGWQPAHAF